jgi:hypothetical protein
MQNESAINPYFDNPSVKNQISNIISYKNYYGFVGEQLGSIDLVNFSVSDNNIGIQIHLTNFSFEAVVIKNAALVGYSTGNYESSPIMQNSTGLITARTDGLVVLGAHFHNFNTTMTAIQSCSQCENTQYLVGGGRTTTFQGIMFDNIMGNFLEWNTPRREIFIDADGSLTAILQQQLGMNNQSRAVISPLRNSLI